MTIHFKRMCKLGKITIINSLVHILTWVFIGAVVGNKELINIFSLTYSLQFLPYMLLNLLVSGNIIGNEKHTISKDAIFTGIVVANLIALCTVIIVTLNIDKVMVHLGTTNIAYKNWLIYACWFMYITLPLICTLELLYFKMEDNKAEKISFIFNLIYCGMVVVLYTITHNEIISITISLIVLAIYTYSILIRQMSKFKFTLNILSGVKYQYNVVASNIMMFLTYFIGMKFIFEYSPEFTLAVSCCALMTDAQWDVICNSISNVAKVEIAKNASDKNNINNLFRANRLFIALVIASVLVTFILIVPIYNASLKYCSIIILFETLDMLMVTDRNIKQSWIDIELKSKSTALMSMGIRIIRMLSAYLPTIYALWIGQIISSVLHKLLYDNKFKKGYQAHE